MENFIFCTVCYVKVCILKSFKNSIKLLASPFFVMFQTFFNRAVLKEKLGTQRAYREYSKGTWALEHSKGT